MVQLLGHRGFELLPQARLLERIAEKAGVQAFHVVHNESENVLLDTVDKRDVFEKIRDQNIHVDVATVTNVVKSCVQIPRPAVKRIHAMNSATSATTRVPLYSCGNLAEDDDPKLTVVDFTVAILERGIALLNDYFQHSTNAALPYTQLAQAHSHLGTEACLYICNFALLKLALGKLRDAMDAIDFFAELDVESLREHEEGGHEVAAAVVEHHLRMQALAEQGLAHIPPTDGQLHALGMSVVRLRGFMKAAPFRTVIDRHLLASTSLYQQITGERNAFVSILGDHVELLDLVRSFIDFLVRCSRSFSPTTPDFFARDNTWLQGLRPLFCNRRSNSTENDNAFRVALADTAANALWGTIALRSRRVRGNELTEADVNHLKEHYRTIRHLASSQQWGLQRYAEAAVAERSGVACDKYHEALAGDIALSRLNVPVLQSAQRWSSLQCKARSYTYPSPIMFCKCKHCSIETLARNEIPGFHDAVHRQTPPTNQRFGVKPTYPQVIINVHSLNPAISETALRAAQQVYRAGVVTKIALTALSHGLQSDEMNALMTMEEGHRRKHRAASRLRVDYFLMSQAYQHSFFFAVTDERIFGRRIRAPFDEGNKTTCTRYVDRPAFLFETINVALDNVWHL